MDGALEILGDLRTNVGTLLVECIGIVLFPSLLNSVLVLLIIRLRICYEKRAGETIHNNTPYPKLALHHPY
jgi:hypothetical protein